MKAEGRDEQDDDNTECRDQGPRPSSKTKSTTGQRRHVGQRRHRSTEQRTKITTVIRNEQSQATTNVNFTISVGTRVPRDGSLPPAAGAKS